MDFWEDANVTECFHGKEKPVPEPVFERFNRIPDYLIEKIHRKQYGGDTHGDLVALSLAYLVEEKELYPSVKQAFLNVELEQKFRGLIPDILDRENKIIIECGHTGFHDETRNDFLDKCVGYTGSLHVYEDIEEWRFLNFPKAIFEEDVREFRELRFIREPLVEFRGNSKRRHRRQ